jgi:hypothetical protein
MPRVSKFISFFVFLLLFSCKSSKIETIDFSDGSYEGELNKKKQKHGKGFFRWSDGSYYNGLYENDKRHGEGRFLWANGESYEGSYVQDQRTGHGTYRWADSSVYKGSFFNGKRHGKGIFTATDGIRYEGEWLHDRQHGKGKLLFPDGKTLSGTWIEGKLVSSNSLPPDASPRPSIQLPDLPAVDIQASMPASDELPKQAEIKPKGKNLVSPTQVSSNPATVKVVKSLDSDNKSSSPKPEPVAKQSNEVIQKKIRLKPEEKKSTPKPEKKLPSENKNTWRGTADDVELNFITELINGLDTIKERKSDLPFSGKMVIVNESGDLVGELNLHNGVLHGKEIFYDTNGKIVEENTWQRGRKL